MSQYKWHLSFQAYFVEINHWLQTFTFQNITKCKGVGNFYVIFEVDFVSHTHCYSTHQIIMIWFSMYSWNLSSVGFVWLPRFVIFCLSNIVALNDLHTYQVHHVLQTSIEADKLKPPDWMSINGLWDSSVEFSFSPADGWKKQSWQGHQQKKKIPANNSSIIQYAALH